MATDVLFADSFNRDELAGQFASWLRKDAGSALVALLPEAETSRVEPLQSLCRELGLPLVGAVFPALIVDGRFHANGLLLLRMDNTPFHLLAADVEQEEPSILAERLTAVLDGPIGDDENTTLFLLFDALVPDIASVVEQFYLRLADRVQYAGVNAGSETFQPMPCLFDSENFIANGMLALLFKDHPGVVLAHGYRAPEHLVAATSTEGNRISSIDWRPAFQVYRERVRSQYGIEITKENFYRYGVHFPFGIVRADNEILVRIPVGLNDDGSLHCVGEVPANSVLTLLEAPEKNSLNTADLIMQRLPALNPTDFVLTFYCAGRRMHLGEGAEAELAALQRLGGGKPVTGALSLGEIGSSLEGGYPLFHNAALVCTRL